MARRPRKRGIYLTELEIENIKSFKGKHRVDLRDERGRLAPWTLILGDNGVGKTTILQCLAMMAPFDNPKEEENRNGRLSLQHFIEPTASLEVAQPVSYARHGDFAVEIMAKFATDARLGDAHTESSGDIATSITFRRTNNETHDFSASRTPSEKGDVPLVIAYGAGRHMAYGNFDPEKMPDPTRSLFDGAIELFDVEELLQHLEYAALKSKATPAKRRYQVLRRMIADLLPDVQSPDSIRIVGPDETGVGKFRVHVSTPYGEVSVRELSWGYQTVAGWLCDIAWRMFQHYPDSTEPLLEPAIILVDEIDLHLHPHWQRRLREKLMGHFPAVQFIATAHSPLMAQASIDANLVVLTRADDSVRVSNEPRIVSTWRLDQIITSELFGLPTEWPVEVERLMEEQRALVANPERTPQQTRRLKDLQARLLSLPTESPEDEEAMSVIRRAAAAIQPRSGDVS